MHLQQYYLECLAQASYLIGDDASGVAVIVDPRRDVDLYVAEAEARGLSIHHVFLTHFHADFASGHLELAERCGAEIHIGRAAKAGYDFTPAAEGDSWTFGDVRISVLETPGHTPESISLLVHDLAKSDEVPHAVLTGDCLFIGDVGRPDLMASVGITREELASQLYDSTRDKLMTLPDETLVYPGHGAGSMCGKSLSSETVSTIGQQRQFNYALQPMSKDEFIALVTEGQPTAPAYFAYDAGFNKKPHALLDDVLADVPRIDADQARQRQAAGAVVLDARDPATFAAGHIDGAVNVGIDGRFATWVGAVLSPDSDLIIVAPDGRATEAATRLGRIGFDRVVGIVDDVSAAGTEHARISPADLASALERDDAPLVVDVRQPGEWAAAHIEGSINVPLMTLRDTLDQIPTDRSVVLHCKSGYRSTVAASVLRQAGRDDVPDLEGGIDAWQAAGLPVTAPDPDAPSQTCSLQA